MKTYKVAELEGKLLRRAVAMAEGHKLEREDGDWAVLFKPDSRLGPCASLSEYGYCPDINWQYGGPIIERERIATLTGGSEREGAFNHWAAFVGEVFIASFSSEGGFGCDPDGQGPTPLIAAMRAYVASKFGDTIELED